MAVIESNSALSAEERTEKRKLIVRDFIALFSLFVITAVLAALTYFLFGSFSRHRDVLARRWRANGERALNSGHPAQAVEALRSALAYAPGDRDIEIELASALASDGRYAEATAYFNSLLEAQPGNGLIHLQLARLAAKQGNAELAQQHYQRALDGMWQGDGYLRRLAVRLELAGYLISRKDYTKAMAELRTAAGNAPDVPETQIKIAEMMEQAQDPEDALEIYRAQMQHRDAPLNAFKGAGRTAWELGRIAVAREALARALAHTGFADQSEGDRDAVRQMLTDSNRILELYPSWEISVRARAERIAKNAELARARLAACFGNPDAAAEQLAHLQDQWQQIPANLTARALEQDLQLEQTTMALVYETERQTAQLCGAPTGDDALLLKIAQAPQAVQQP